LDVTSAFENQSPTRDELAPMLDDYYREGVAQLVDLGGPNIDPTGFKSEFWDELPDFLPPNGRFSTARSSDNEPLGYGTMRRIENNVGELKRLYVKSSSRGIWVSPN